MNGARLRERLNRGECLSMLTTHYASPGHAVRLTELGADAIFLDCEHGTWSFEDIRLTAQAIRGAGGAAIVRPDCHQRSLLIRYLNAGADALMVPMVENAIAARAIVDAVRYGCHANHDQRLVIAMIETVGAIERLEEVLAVEGVDVFFVGPGDLSQDMGFAPAPPVGEARPQAVQDKVGEAVAKIRAAGKVAGTLASLAELPHWRNQGVQFFYTHSDPFLRRAMTDLKDLLS
ncbi:MAG: 2,4-dihydroxyhept-2-ene-1,7-dioic acid aldolase [Bosea sp.]|uniref:HpcH/HpaI aldolase family protein n=1 Tax=Bosea sp. (in: a-proteobacteria) TaxID=1871050 RepID=UPI0023944B60|nr:2,4-dihydroxyhept-2-ene-1,7-dioic acid aldolase [Bosea sp. (in: a-proteobacteria)]MCP4737396.1 2,4-dihydroxyhept-2-ene-1,7-dioic acid aldolase [Bosea sp. (in: a-proteobacteria)]